MSPALLMERATIRVIQVEWRSKRQLSEIHLSWRYRSREGGP